MQFVSGGPVYTGVGMNVASPSGNSLSVCRVRVSPPPATIVMQFPDAHGTVVITRSGVAIVIFN